MVRGILMMPSNEDTGLSIDDLVIFAEMAGKDGTDLSPTAQWFVEWYRERKKYWFAEREIIAQGELKHFTGLMKDLRVHWFRDENPPVWLSEAQPRENEDGYWWEVVKAGDPEPIENRHGTIEVHELPQSRIRVVFKPLHFPDRKLFWQMTDKLVQELARLKFVLQPPSTEDEASKMGIFYAYAREDEDLRDELEKHLKMLEREGVITNWHDRRIDPGKEWEDEIDTHLNTARVILLLISSDFINSDYCWNVEVERAMERHEAGEARVIPVILRSVDWKGAPFGKLQALPTDAKPVTSWENRDEAFSDIAQGIRTTAMKLRAEDNDSVLNHEKHNPSSAP